MPKGKGIKDSDGFHSPAQLCSLAVLTKMFHTSIEVPFQRFSTSYNDYSSNFENLIELKDKKQNELKDGWFWGRRVYMSPDKLHTSVAPEPEPAFPPAPLFI